MMPSPGVTKDFNYIKETALSKLREIRVSHIDDVLKAVEACKTRNEITKCLEKFGIGITYPC